MKRLFQIISVIAVLVIPFAIGAPKPYLAAPAQCGYSIVEFGKAVNCAGDTITLVRRNGVQVRADS